MALQKIANDMVTAPTLKSLKQVKGFVSYATEATKLFLLAVFSPTESN